MIFVLGGLLLCVTLIGIIVGLPLALGGLKIMFLGPVRASRAPKGQCPYCGEVVSALGFDLLVGRAINSKETQKIGCCACKNPIAVQGDVFR